MTSSLYVSGYYRSSYRAGEQSRANAHLPSFALPGRTELENGKLSVLRVRCRWVYKNCSLPNGAVETFVKRIAGAGFGIQSRMRNAEGAIRDENKALERILGVHFRKITPQGHSLREVVKTAVRVAFTDGDMFLVKTDKPGRVPIAREWQIIPADQICENMTKEQLPEVVSGNDVILGVEVEPDGRIAAYHFYTDGGDVFGYNLSAARKTRRVTADRVIHFYDPIIPDVPRGIPRMLAMILDAADEEELRKATLTQAWTQATIPIAIETPFPEEMNEGRGATDETATDATLQQSIGYENGQELHLAPGEKAIFTSPSTPGATYDNFTRNIERAQSRPFGISYEKYSGDFKGVSFAGGRLLELDDRMTFAELAASIDERILTPLYEDAVDYVYRVHKLRPMPAAEDIYASFVQRPQPGWVDPVAAQNGYEKGVNTRTYSRRRACAEAGLDFFDVADELAEENEYLASKGLTDTADSESAAPAEVSPSEAQSALEQAIKDIPGSE